MSRLNVNEISGISSTVPEIATPAFSAYASTTTSVNNGATTKVELATVRYDTNNFFSNSRFTPTIAGYYQFNFASRMENKTFQALLYKNQGTETYAGTNTTAGMYCSSGSALVYLNGTTDYVELYTFNGGTTGTVSSNSGQTFLNGFLVRAV